MRALVGDALPPELVERIAERSGGNPLFVEELLRTWVSVGMLAERADATWRLTTPAADVELPLTVQAIYAAQLDDLPRAARSAARRAAVAGRRFPRDALDVLEVEEPEAALATLVSARSSARAARDVLLGASHVVSARAAPRRRLREPHPRRPGAAARTARGLAREPRREDAPGARRGDRPALRGRARQRPVARARDRRSLPRGARGDGRDVVRAGSAVALGFAAWASARDLVARALDLTDESQPVERGAPTPPARRRRRRARRRRRRTPPPRAVARRVPRWARRG